MKRKLSATAPARPRKKPRRVGQSASATTSAADHPVLCSLYPQVLTLRQYLLAVLPLSSKNRRRRIAQVGVSASPRDAEDCDAYLQLAELLDSTLVGRFTTPEKQNSERVRNERLRDLELFTQQLSQSTAAGTYRPDCFLQAEAVDFVVWCLFKRCAAHKPSNLLCYGYQRSGNSHRPLLTDVEPVPSIPGLTAYHPNTSVATLKGPLWCRVQALLGRGGDRLIIDLLLENAIFCPIDGGIDNFYQLSGPPISDLKPHVHAISRQASADESTAPSRKLPVFTAENRALSSISFVRSRMLYAKPAFNAKGEVRFGLRHIHILERCSNRDDVSQTVHLMRYIFPRQFGLHNVFTSRVDPRETAMPFKDYTLRENEIHQSMCRDLGKKSTVSQAVQKWKTRLPKRLRGSPITLASKFRVRHHRCSYTELLRYYCPIEDVDSPSRLGCADDQLRPGACNATAIKVVHRVDKNLGAAHESEAARIRHITDLACPVARVSAFCRAVTAKVIPRGFWGSATNERVVMYWIDQFVNLRRFESLTLHQVTQKIKMSHLTWLQLPWQRANDRIAKSDTEKQNQIFMEFVYWVFDSFLVPLIRSNFYVTESNAHRNQLFYFRHDVWRRLTGPSLITLKLNMFEEMPTDRMTKLLSVRPLGYSKIRLLPKNVGFRTITNLRRRQQIIRNGVMSLGRSINTVMAPVFNAITYEKTLQPQTFGGALFSVGDMLPKLAAFASSLRQQGLSGSPLYFAKVDVQSCFDTIPQARLLHMIQELMKTDIYQTGKYVEVSPLGALQRLNGQHDNSANTKRYISHSIAASAQLPFNELVQRKPIDRKANTIFVENNLRQQDTKDDLMQLLREHVERNLIKIGKRYYRQKKGIPQGSVLSSILCNFFYAELERDVLGFTSGSDCLLLRLLDDFLLITANRQKGERFTRVMHRGLLDYGVVVEAAKSLVSFDMVTEAGHHVPRCASTKFPYCGVIIDTATLEVEKKPEHGTMVDIDRSLTVDLSRMPGRTFHRKALNAFKIQLKAMFIDVSLNSVSTVLTNLYRSFSEAAVRCFAYVRELSKTRKTRSSLLITTVDNIVGLAFVMVQRGARSRSKKAEAGAQQVISRRHVQWLAYHAFHKVFGRKQTRHRALLDWLEGALERVRISSPPERSMLEAVLSSR